MGYLLSALTILWCSFSASSIFASVLRLSSQRFLVAYPVGLLYAAFALLSVFDGKTGNLGGKWNWNCSDFSNQSPLPYSVYLFQFIFLPPPPSHPPSYHAQYTSSSVNKQPKEWQCYPAPSRELSRTSSPLLSPSPLHYPHRTSSGAMDWDQVMIGHSRAQITVYKLLRSNLRGRVHPPYHRGRKGDPWEQQKQPLRSFVHSHFHPELYAHSSY